MKIKHKTPKYYGIIGGGMAISEVIKREKEKGALVKTLFGEEYILEKDIIEEIKNNGEKEKSD